LPCLTGGWDEGRSTAIFVGTFGGFSEYVYSLKMVDGKVTEMTKIWNDAYAFKIMSSAEPESEPEPEPPSL
jgi:hypothetical protein